MERANWSQQSLNNEALPLKVSAILASASQSLLKEVLDISKQNFDKVVKNIEDKKTQTPDEIWLKGIHSYNFCYNHTSQRLTKKLQKISSIDTMQILLPHHSFSSSCSYTHLSERQPPHPQPQQHAGAPGDQDDREENFPPTDDPMSKKIFFTPDMIIPIPYDVQNFKPIIIYDVEVPDNLIKLSSLSPSFSLTPP